MCIARILLISWFNLGSTSKSVPFPAFNSSMAAVRLPRLRLAEGVVMLNKVHPVSEENFPSAEDNGIAAGLIQMYESRVPHYHVSRLRDAHEIFRGGSEKTLQEIQSHSGYPVQANEEQPQSLLKRDDNAPHEKSHDSRTVHSEAYIRMTNLKDSQYVGPLKVGSQGDILSVVYDTGSTNLWFASTLCKAGPCLRRRRYDPQGSSSFQQGDFDIHVTFGTGELFGQSGVDDVEMGGFKVKHQTFSMIEKEKGSIFEQLDFEGILGLAFPAMAARGSRPFFDQVIDQQLLKTNAFSFYFTKLPTDGSAVFFGDVDPQLYQGDLIGIPVNEEYYWRVGLKSFKIGNKVIDGPKQVVFDTGTTYYTTPKSLMPTVLALMPQVDCQKVRDGTADLPDLTFTMAGHDGKDVTLIAKPSEYYVSSGHDHKCDPAFMAIEVPSTHGPAYILGEAFMRTYFTSFHRGDGKTNPQVKVARINPDAVDLVRDLKKVEGMSVNQKKLAAASLVEGEERKCEGPRQAPVEAILNETGDGDKNAAGFQLRGLA